MGKEINIGLIGFGTVGTGVVQYFAEGHGKPHGVTLRKVVVADLEKRREIPFGMLTDSVSEVIDDPSIDIVVEVMGGESPATDYLLRAIRNKKSIVTANKVVVSRHLKELSKAAREAGANVSFEASVAGGIPIIRVLNGYRGEKITRIMSILNGTSNYILSRMQEGHEFEAALQKAQQEGFAEADHSLDTGGLDARDKLAIMASLVFDCPIDPERIYCEGMADVTRIDLDFASKYEVEEGQSGYTIKPLAIATLNGDNKLELHVYPALLSNAHPLSAVRDEFNAVYIEGELCGPQLFLGRGAGRAATTSAVISDILNTARNLRRGVVDELPALESNPSLADVTELKRQGYLRLNLRHKPGSIAEASRILADLGFNIKDSMQRRRFEQDINGEKVIPDILTFEALSSRTVARAMDALERCSAVHGRPFHLRFEEL